MNVPNITQSPTSAPALPRAFAAGETLTPPGAGAGAVGPVRPHSPAPTIALTRLACFDVNGDGHIDPSSAFAGGDATLLVPTHQVDLPTWPHAVNPLTPAHQPAPPVAAANEAQTRRALGAYERYGQSAHPAPSAPASNPLPAAVPVVAPAPPAAATDPTPAPAGSPAGTSGPAPTGPVSGR